MNLRRLAFIICASALVASPAAAQIAPGLSGKSSTSTFGGSEAWSTLRDFGRCYAWTQRTNAIALVSTRPGSVDEAALYKRLFSKPYQSCLSLATEMRFDQSMVRGAIAEGLYQKGVPVPANLAVTAAPGVENVRNLSDASLCYAATNRARVQTLLGSTNMGSKEEAEAVEKLMPEFSRCIPAAAKTVSLSYTQLRTRLAEAMWRLNAFAEERK